MARPERRAAGFTLVEVIVVMAIISVLMGFGIGMFQKLTAVGSATQAENTVVDLIQQVKTSSLTRPAALVLQPGRDDAPARAYGMIFAPIQMSSFEPARGEPEEGTTGVPGLSYKNGRFDAGSDGRLMPYPWGRTGGCLVFEPGSTGGIVNFGNYDEYDLVEGVSISVWVYPTENRPMDLLVKGDSYGIRLRPGSSGPRVEGFLTLAESDDVSKGARGSREVFPVPGAELVMNRWNGIGFHYDRAAVTISIDSFERGAVERLRREESRPILPDRDEDMTIGSDEAYCLGRVDDLKVYGILSDPPRELPADVELLGERRTIRFVDGKLDPTVHRGPQEIVLRRLGVENPIKIGVLGNIILK